MGSYFILNSYLEFNFNCNFLLSYTKNNIKTFCKGSISKVVYFVLLKSKQGGAKSIRTNSVKSIKCKTNKRDREY